MGAFYLAALVFLWAGRRGNVSRKLAVVVSAVCLLAGSGALAAAVYPWGNSYGVTVNRLQDLPGSGKSVPENAETVTPLPGGAKSAAPLPDGPAQKPAPGSGKSASPVMAAGGYMALTFDDGPYPPYTDRLLDVLKEKKAHATFFLVAEQAQKHPELVRRMAAEGHTVGLHAYRHRDFLKLAEEERQKDLALGKKVLHDITGKEPVYWRPPHGFQNGSIVLLHDGDSPFYKASRQATVDAAGLLIDSLREKGYHLVSLEEYAQLQQLP